MRGNNPFLSIVIPAYNSWGTVVVLLMSLVKSRFKNFEVIIGDDASHTEKHQALLALLKKKIGVRVVQLVRLPINHGPAGARNTAAKLAKGHVLVFLDADVTCYSDTLANIAKKFMDDADLTALTGVWDKHQKTRAFFPQFKALRDWSYWINERESDGYYYLFSTRIAAIKRDVFARLGGFNEAFRQMEDVEITYRIAKRYAIIFAPDVRVHHEFEGFVPVAKKYFWRSFYWSRLWQARRKFDPVATTARESVAAATGVGAVFIIFIGMAVFFFLPHTLVKLGTLVLFGCFMIIHLFLLRKFLRFVWKEKGTGFMLQALVTGLALYCVIAAGAVYWAIFSYISTQTRLPRVK